MSFDSLRRVAGAVALLVCAAGAAAQSDVITYQGQLNDAGAPASGTYDIRVGLWDQDAGGTMLAEHVATVLAADGVFTIDDLPFADFFDGTDRWISIAVAPQGGAEVPLAGRQPVTLSPHAAYAQRSGTSLQDAHDNGGAIQGDVDIDGVVDIGGTTNGRLRVYSDFTSNILVDLRNDSTRGGRVDIRDDDNDIVGFMAVDPSGGGRFSISRLANGAEGFIVDGNYQGADATRVDIVGEERFAAFDMSAAGDAAVFLPDGSISSGELFDEPGVAEIHANALSTDIEPGIGPILSRSISVPRAGYVLAIANLEVLVAFNTGIRQSVFCGISDEPDAYFEGIELSQDIPAGTNAGSYNFVISPSMVFPVDDAGTFTYYLLAQEIDGNPANIVRASDAQLTLVYIPSAYGMVGLDIIRSGAAHKPENVPGRPAAPLSPSAVLAERLAETERQLDAMARRQEELEAALRDNQRRLETMGKPAD